MLKEARNRIEPIVKLLFNNRLRFCRLLHRDRRGHCPSRREQGGFTFRRAEMLQHLRETGGAEVYSLGGRFAFGGLGADGAESGQDPVTLALPVQSGLDLAHGLNQRDRRIKMRFCAPG